MRLTPQAGTSRRLEASLAAGCRRGAEAAAVFGRAEVSSAHSSAVETLYVLLLLFLHREYVQAMLREVRSTLCSVRSSTELLLCTGFEVPCSIHQLRSMATIWKHHILPMCSSCTSSARSLPGSIDCLLQRIGTPLGRALASSSRLLGTWPLQGDDFNKLVVTMAT
ncbi:hypothetical protein ASPZODRAFT_754369 [Penicilliopsis zonata CBS 506.65]|uniref:Uncharacterized protein n=1 Tax=Penicilliopsis zonata CBS 506.65 TaxID=1073090 RepID=A0A1L9SAN8_9EURO|nr:hypothetical protein ASPZODRAFT_754369 [Penicilliopsis zonata CBS 506.65]OJJ44250.1 hypothetical protein ASPZODRAFT_754369 [Penicilliopsis zonata CBS 506.65]